MSKRKITIKIIKCFELNESEAMIQQKLWNTAKPIFRGKCRVLNEHIKKKERLKIDDLSIYLQTLEKNSILNLKEAGRNNKE